jgi:hypothetical protein
MIGPLLETAARTVPNQEKAETGINTALSANKGASVVDDSITALGINASLINFRRVQALSCQSEARMEPASVSNWDKCPGSGALRAKIPSGSLAMLR